MGEDKPKGAPGEAPVLDLLEARFQEIWQTVPLKVRTAIEDVGQVEAEENGEPELIQRETAEDSARQLGEREEGEDPAKSPQESPRKRGRRTVLMAIMNDDLTSGGNEDSKKTFEATAILGASAVASHPLIKEVKDGCVFFDFSRRESFPPGVEDISMRLAETLAPYAAVAMVSNQRLYNAGRPYGLEGAFRDQNMHMMGGLIEDYFEKCLIGTTIPLTLRPGLESAEAEISNREALLKFCLKYYVGTYLKQLLPEYLNLLLEAKMRAEQELPVNFGAMAEALTQTIATRFPKFG